MEEEVEDEDETYGELLYRADEVFEDEDLLFKCEVWDTLSVMKHKNLLKTKYNTINVSEKC